jgi:hypothetical protein
VKSLTLDKLRRDGEAMSVELSREFHQSGAGYKASAELQPIYAKYPHVLGDEALSLVRGEFESAAEGSEARRGARLLLDWQVDGLVARELASMEEKEIAWESSAVVKLADGRSVPYQQLAIDIANTADRTDRLSLEKARAATVGKEFAPMRLEHFQREMELTARLGIAKGYIETFVTLSGVDLHALAAQCAQFLRDTQAMWDDTVKERVKTKLGISIGEAVRADALALMRVPEFDAHFPGKSLESAARRNMSELGIDATASGRVVFDAADREGKRSRAFCAPVRIPDEVYLVMRPHGGQTDYATFMHELGHALHFGYMRADYPFEYRWLGDNSVTESYAMLFDHLLQNAGWLLRYTELGKSDLAAFQRAAGFEELQFLRRYCGKLLYEIELHGGSHSWSALPDLYVQTLTAATSFRYDPADAFVDVDPRFYSARYLRAWQLQAVIAESLVERFDEDWYRNPKAGPYIVGQLYGEGQRELAHELAERVAGRGLSFDPLARAAESLLAAV